MFVLITNLGNKSLWLFNSQEYLQNMLRKKETFEIIFKQNKFYIL